MDASSPGLNQQLSAEEVFEITDFTTASEWERFIAHLEEIINEWKLNVSRDVRELSSLRKDALGLGKWTDRSQQISFNDQRFVVSHRRFDLSPLSAARQPINVPPALEDQDLDDLPESSSDQVFVDLLSSDNDFPARAHCICRWLGLREFITISPNATSGTVISSESHAQLILSSVVIAISNSCCQIPIFIQISNSWKRLYRGAYENSTTGQRVVFDMAYLKALSPRQAHLSGLLEIFFEKLGISPRLPANVNENIPVHVSIRFTYTVTDFGYDNWMQNPPDISEAPQAVLANHCNLPFGTSEDSLVELHLSCVWLNLSHDTIVESDTYCDLDPSQAPIWTVRAKFADKPHCVLYDCLNKFCQLVNFPSSLPLAGQPQSSTTLDASQSSSPDVSRLLDRMANKEVPSLTRVVSEKASQLTAPSRIRYAELSDPILLPILAFIFPDSELAKTQLSRCNIPNYSFGDKGPLPIDFQDASIVKNYQDDLLSRLALSLCRVCSEQGGYPGLAHLWREFVLELRFRFEHSTPIVGLQAGPPNLNKCLLYQKLQMLNCCINAKLSRDKSDLSAKDADQSSDSSKTRQVDDRPTSPQTAVDLVVSQGKQSESNDNDDSDDEFFDADSDLAGTSETVQQATYQGEGQLEPHPMLMLLKHPDTPLYVPITQEPSPFTEDMLEVHTQQLTSMGTSTEGAIQRMEAQSFSLRSDMEAFKAANPLSEMADFIRWYSPRDYNTEHGLSERMKVDENIWQATWDQAKPVPATRQKRLFDDTAEAEKVLQYLSSLTIQEVLHQLVPVIVQRALHRIVTKENCNLPGVVDCLKSTLFKVTALSSAQVFDLHLCTEILNQVRWVESQISNANSLFNKLNSVSSELAESDTAYDIVVEIWKCVHSLLREPEVNLVGGARGPLGKIFYEIFSSSEAESTDDVTSGSQGVFGAPLAREYIMRTSVPRPHAYSKSGPQRMFAVLTNDSLRLCGAFTEDIS